MGKYSSNNFKLVGMQINEFPKSKNALLILKYSSFIGQFEELFMYRQIRGNITLRIDYLPIRLTVGSKTLEF